MTGLGIGLAALTLPLTSHANTVKSSYFRAGAGRANVRFPTDLYPMNEFVGEHDPLAVRVLLLDDGGERISIAVVDLTSISGELVTGMKTILSEIAQIAPDNIIICASHTFSAPHVFPARHIPADTDSTKNDVLLRAFETALRSAATQAVAALQPARMGFASGISRIGVNRDVPTKHGWWLGANDAGFADPFLGVLRIDGRDGKPLAILMNVSVQSSIMDGSQRAGGGLISADLAGAAARHAETHYGSDAVALFLVGAAGDQSPYLQANRHVVNDDGSVGRVDLHEAGFMLVDLLGERLGANVIDVAEHAVMQTSASLGVWRENIEVASQVFSPGDRPVGPVARFTYQPGPSVALPVVLMRIGRMLLVGVQTELAASIGARIRDSSPHASMMVATMVDGAAKYMPDASSYDRFTYEARNSPYSKGAAEVAAAAIIDKLQQINVSKN
ncbi:hypothetical protein FJU30_08955 [Affinibrenneria salicis]|uniref:Neutral/alkaline non-lysosomal ceramidase N-terminal domain-containing protein n=2 Tax=Affinibrenneria salicis TaxID=2590031 RepID=A0A5J5G3B7_9GAMM|nr:hypothetical protein FJU30_08955 [Affinibrenneria salicis]